MPNYHSGNPKGQYIMVGDAMGMFTVHREVLNDNELGKFVAVRPEAPVFQIEGDTQDEVIGEGFKTIRTFLTRIHTFGFRNAA
jgi:hypothetical protein